MLGSDNSDTNNTSTRVLSAGTGEESLIYRILDKQELPRIHKIVASLGTTFDPKLTLAAVAETANHDHDILAMVMLRMLWHLEPIWISSPHVDFRRLIKPIEAALPKFQTYYAFSETAKINRMCEINNMRKMGWSIFQKVIGE